jgi:hypothetical protein
MDEIIYDKFEKEIKPKKGKIKNTLPKESKTTSKKKEKIKFK